MKDHYRGYMIESASHKQKSGKWSVSVIIERKVDDKRFRQQFTADDGIEYILEIEAIHESLNLGKRLIDQKSI